MLRITPGWIGKPHALQKAYEMSTVMLLFTDADVRFQTLMSSAEPSPWQRNTTWTTSSVVRDRNGGFWEKLRCYIFLVFVFTIATDPLRASNPHSLLLRGSRRVPDGETLRVRSQRTHRRVAMEILMT